MLTLTPNTLQEIQTLDAFHRFFKGYVEHVSIEGVRLFPGISLPRLADAHHFWVEDLKRLQFSFAPGAPVVPDHYKQAAMLTYWLRRQAPVVEYKDLGEPVQDGDAIPVDAAHRQVRDILFNYGGEYLAFDLGYLIVRFYEVNRLPTNATVREFKLTPDYIKSMCVFLKEKNVSPHALFMIYKSLFFDRFT